MRTARVPAAAAVGHPVRGAGGGPWRRALDIRVLVLLEVQLVRGQQLPEGVAPAGEGHGRHPGLGRRRLRRLPGGPRLRSLVRPARGRPGGPGAGGASALRPRAWLPARARARDGAAARTANSPSHAPHLEPRRVRRGPGLGFPREIHVAHVRVVVQESLDLVPHLPRGRGGGVRGAAGPQLGGRAGRQGRASLAGRGARSGRERAGRAVWTLPMRLLMFPFRRFTSSSAWIDTCGRQGEELMSEP